MRTFIPAGPWLPDQKAFQNPGLRRAYGVIPFSRQSYLLAPGFSRATDLLPLGTEPVGAYLHENASGALYYYGTETSLNEISLGAPSPTPQGTGYGFGGSVGVNEFWHMTAYGDNVVATNYHNPVQYAPAPPSAFVAMINSTFKPQARFAFPLRQNLFLANVKVLATYGPLAAGDHPWLVCWSQNDNIRSFGTPTVDPALLGSGHQELGNDLGPITAAFGPGEYGLLWQHKGITRIDGPPYEFRTIDRDETCRYPFSIQSYRGDVYFWGATGPTVLRGGEGGAIPLLDGVALRSLTVEPESADGFSEVLRSLDDDHARAISCAVDRANGVVRWSIVPAVDSYIVETVVSTPIYASGAVVDYHVASDRFSISALAPSPSASSVSRASFLQTRTPDYGSPWGPHRTTYFIESTFNASGPVDWKLSLFSMSTTNRPLVELQTGLVQLHELQTARIKRVRPVWSRGAGSSAVTQEVYVSVTNNPHANTEVTYGPYTTMDVHGWFPATGTPYADFNAIGWKADPNESGDGRYIAEIEGFEIEYDTQGSYGA